MPTPIEERVRKFLNDAHKYPDDLVAFAREEGALAIEASAAKFEALDKGEGVEMREWAPAMLREQAKEVREGR